MSGIYVDWNRDTSKDIITPTSSENFYAWIAYPHVHTVDNNLYSFYTTTLNIDANTVLYDSTGAAIGIVHSITSDSGKTATVVEVNGAKITLSFDSSAWEITWERDKVNDIVGTTPIAIPSTNTIKLYAWRQNDTVIYTLTPNVDYSNWGYDCFFDAQGNHLEPGLIVHFGTFEYATTDRLYFKGEY